MREAGISFVHKNKGQGSNSSQWEQPEDNTVRGYNPDRKTRREEFNKGERYAGNDGRDRRQDFNQQKGYNPGRRARDFDGQSGPRRDDFNRERHGGNDRGDRKQGFNSAGFNSDRNKRNYDQKSGPRRDNFSREQRFGGNDSGDRIPNRSNNKENSNYRDRGSFREKRDDSRQTDYNHQRQEITNDVQRTENQTNQRENMSRGGQQRSSDRKADYQDNKPPRFQKHSDTHNDSVNVSVRTTAREEAGLVATGKNGRRNDVPPIQSRYTPPVRPGEPCQAKYWDDGQVSVSEVHYFCLIW